MSAPLRGFLLTRQWDDLIPEQDKARGGLIKSLALQFWILTDRGPARLIVSDQYAVCFLESSAMPVARRILTHLLGDSSGERPPWYEKELELRDFGGQPVHGVYLREQRNLYRVRDMLTQAGLSPMEADIHPTDRFLMERFVTGSLAVHGEAVEKDGVLEFHNPRIKPAPYAPYFKVLSLDIETSMDGAQLYSIGLVATSYGADVGAGAVQRRVFMVGEPAADGSDYLIYCADETQVFQRFIAWFDDFDPDILIGWNVINFDLRFLQKKADDLNLSFHPGRGGTPMDWRQSRSDDQHFTLCIPGRVVLDGIDTLKSATYNFESFSLEYVAQHLLGRGKLIHDPDNRGDEITHLFLHDKPRLAEYNLEDCQLVWEVFQHALLIEFAVERAQLTGLALDRFGGSVASFDNRYLPRLHRAGYVAPMLPQNPVGVGSPGGYVMDSIPGLYRNVLVLDFKSLYPSIIRTFKIDPLARIKGVEIERGQDVLREDLWDQQETVKADRKQLVPGFNGAVFSKEHNILPDIIGELWAARDEAKRHKNAAMSQAIKILMNSFYGVLGTPGCRFFDHRLPSSITLRGHRILYRTKELIEQQGHQVIYGDTDSVFVRLKEYKQSAAAEIDSVGKKLAATLNQWWRDYLMQEYGIESFLEIQFETHFLRFVMPTIRGSEKGSKKRYAGLAARGEGEPEMVFKGLETVRTDWTPLARTFQKELYRRIFYNEPYEDYVRDLVSDIRAGKKDDQLYYRKRLRRRLDEYQRNVPPHVQAARTADRIREEQGLAPRYQRGGWIEYVVTVNGPEPLEYRRSALDYDLYVERQIEPIADGILRFMNASFQDIAGGQIGLF
ncbi:DNA polymerase II [Hahella aquimaris]|uniref:DNA polymerase II n=1 Tax=Hahella sp. HNIBRBA332 TaxID=3015983 RepID=UPI00273C8DFF|nr:DNA polymerase II [Hahella sp. HNIBRBA332]WLQ11714.1 DNA polymerase II [Hahella sp. HNIBRBA332]